MTITTRQGDKGNTRLYSGETVSKRSQRIGICGDIDELVCAIGVAKQYSQRIRPILEKLQRNLFSVASEVATKDTKKLYIITGESDVKDLDNYIKKFEQRIEIPNGFIIPGSNIRSAYVDLARATCRRCEREIVRAYNEGIIDNRYLLMWMNRLSDLLYLLARCVEEKPELVKEQNINEQH